MINIAHPPHTPDVKPNQGKQQVKRPYLAALVVIGIICWHPMPATAQNFDFDGEFLLPGLNIGATYHQQSQRFLLGAEVSIASLTKDQHWFGAYLDGAWVTGTNGFRHSIGAQAGIWFVGAEVGYLGQLHQGRYHPGIRLGIVATCGLASLYLRWGHLFGDTDLHNYGEGGLLLKIPIRS